MRSAQRWHLPAFTSRSRRCAILLLVSGCAATSGQAQLTGRDDPLAPELRARVEELKTGVEAEPTTNTTIHARAQVLWAWANRLAVAGVVIPPGLPRWIAQIRRQAVTDERSSPAAPGTVLTRMVDHAVRELQIKEENPRALGDLARDGAGPYVAGSRIRFSQTYTVGEMPMVPGGGIVPAVTPLSGGGRVPVEITCSRPEARFERGQVLLTAGLDEGRPRAEAFILLPGVTLEEGETITVTYGGEEGVAVPTGETDAWITKSYVDLEGGGNYLTPRWPAAQVVGGPVARVRAFAPSIVATGEPFRVSVRSEDAFYNRASGRIPPYELLLNGEPHSHIPAGGNALVLLPDLALPRPGVYRFAVRSTGDAANARPMAAVSNPTWVRDDPPYRIFWGDTHGHTGMSVGTGTPDHFLRYGREDARLDFVALSEHDAFLDDGEWRELVQAARRHHEPGQFIPFLAYEWSAATDMGGHHNVLFATPEGRERIGVQSHPRLWDLLLGLHRGNREDGVLIIPHAHSPGDWRLADPQFTRLVEIASKHGTFEWLGENYLKNGHQVGFIGASDDVGSKPGYSAPELSNRPRSEFPGLAAVLAPEKNAQVLFEAMRSLSTYATTGRRIVLDAHLDGTGMGQRLPWGGRRHLEMRVMGEGPIDSIEVFKNGRRIHRRDYATTSLRPRVWVQVSFESESHDFVRDTPRGHRTWQGVLQVEGARVRDVSAPGFVNHGWDRLEIDAARPGRIRFRTTTRGRPDAFLVELDGASPDTRLEIHLDATQEGLAGFPRIYRHARLPAQDMVFEFSAFQSGRQKRELPVDLRVGRYLDVVGLQLVDPHLPWDQELEFTDLEAPAHGDYYYVRITQLDGMRAWSSPWWIGGTPPR